ncbi:hypothetical protein FAZ15_18990 [Sphingobacterium olei]|uniref:Uncharacterized protein n=1 Tax=Sphingobacterium olei TaxID=2571155 RepID=A0A4U0NEP6_9SPHI|nr:hypothetical protein [Sphingobacterium olei]TJZ52480.1 hypothetical protein FAZ15_18990 [Sphingobacterium olei]
MNQQDIIKEIGQIRSIMEKSSKFISISGLSGVLIGTYALIGAALSYITVYGFKSQFGYRDYFVTDEIIIFKLLLIALFVLLISIVTGILMAKRKAKRINQSIWNATSRSLLFAVAVPLITGGVFSLIIFARGYYGLIASSLLIFYGLALTAASTYTFREVKWLGIFEIILGLLALCFPGYGLWFWALGFGVLHIIYGLIVYKRYE